MTAPVLVVEDRKSLAAMLEETLRAEGYEVETVHRGDDAVRRLGGGRRYLAVLSDLRLPGADGLAVLQAARTADPTLPVFLITGYATVETAVTALKLGARDYFQKPLDIEQVLAAVRAAVAPRTGPVAALALDGLLPEMVGSAPSFLRALDALRRVAPTDAAVLLLGASGTGKELFARAVHLLSSRTSGPFVAFNCAAVPETLVESELFGHERGAFTGATSRHIGRFEQAAGGTLFLDEIGEVPLQTQSKLLRAVEERCVSRLGGERDVPVDTRIVAATNRDLAARVAEGSFRRDLYHRLAVFPVTLPTLAERRDDIPSLAVHLAARAARKHGVAVPEFRPSALAALVLADWPGNVRELANVVERVTILASGRAVSPVDLGIGRDTCRAGLDDPEARAVALRVVGAEVEELAVFLDRSVRSLTTGV